MAGQLTAFDADDGAVLTWTGSAAGTWGSFEIDPAGAWSYTLGPAAQALAGGQTVTESFTATLSDGQGGSATQDVTLTITGANDGPVIDSALSDLTGAVTENDAPAASGQLLASDADGTAVITAPLALRADGVRTGAAYVYEFGVPAPANQIEPPAPPP
mgnify:CR=1 FL=1